MKQKTLFASGLTIAALMFASASYAADAPSVDSILTKYVTVLGGKAALEKITSRVIKFKLQSETTGASEGEVDAKAPNKQWSQFEITGSGMMSEGFDGTIAWAKTPWEGLRAKTGDELAKVKRDAEFHRDVKLKTLYPDLAYKATEKVDGEEAYVLESKPTASSKERLSFSTKSGLMIRQEAEFEGPQGAVSTTVLAQDYQPFEGIKYPQTLKIKVSVVGQNFEFTMKVAEIKHNVKIEDAKFAKPAA